ncbi:hypothetical protein HBI56_166210 [Parastagonospora nodorum]|nr:hypothetical protein HBH51_040970 [Parastagonospora nodorum]KAH3983137.1 hypothetical protein HBH52_068560 [Parastagonospora nodorum]KAH3994890.1 hypothetical protein HBI10_180860 [Parastagonospora nodorum]KAH4015038.1 hypothetical protein HBI13_165990 [Parastagonospora nodorum]KAH4024487.1 hypothetical protein HBI09_161430 [Parastagonospora nodorum]
MNFLQIVLMCALLAIVYGRYKTEVIDACHATTSTLSLNLPSINIPYWFKVLNDLKHQSSHLIAPFKSRAFAALPLALRVQLGIASDRSLAVGSACLEAAGHIWVLLADVNRLMDTVERILRFVMSDMAAVALIAWLRLIVCATTLQNGLAIGRLVQLLGHRWIMLWLVVLTVLVILV